MIFLRKKEIINQIVTIPDFLSDFEIGQIFDLCKEKDFHEAEIAGNKFNKNTEEEKYAFLKDYKFKNNTSGVVKSTRETNIKWIELDDETNWLFDKLIQCINDVNSNNYGYILEYVEHLQFSEYTSENKGFYGRHVDCKNRFSMSNFDDIRKLSFTIQLSHFCEYEGGELRFYTGEKSIYTNQEYYCFAPKDKGSITFFPSHIMHEVTPVTKGNRYSLVSWVNGPNIL